MLYVYVETRGFQEFRVYFRGKKRGVAAGPAGWPGIVVRLAGPASWSGLLVRLAGPV